MADQWSTGSTTAGTTEGGGVREQAGGVASTAADQASTVAGAATEQAGAVASTAADGAKQVAGEAAQQAANVASEVKTQVSGLVNQASGELRTQGDAQTERLAEGLRTVAGQLQALLDGRTEEAGPLPDLARQATGQLQSLAGRIGEGGTDGVVNDLQRFARRKPGTFLVGAAAAGFLGGRFIRGMQASQSSSSAPATGLQPPASPMLPPPATPYAGATTDGGEVVVLNDDPSATAPGTIGMRTAPIGSGGTGGAL